MKIKLKTLKELMEQYEYEIIRLDGMCIKKIKVNGRTLAPDTLDYLGNVIEVENGKYVDDNFILNNRGSHLWIPDWVVEDIVEPKFKIITEFEDFYRLVGTDKLYKRDKDTIEYYKSYLGKINSIYLKKTILRCWHDKKLVYYERKEDPELKGKK